MAPRVAPIRPLVTDQRAQLFLLLKSPPVPPFTADMETLHLRRAARLAAVLLRAGELPADEAATLAALCESLPMGRVG